MTRRPFAVINGIGVAVPKRVVTNDDLSQALDTSDEWIRERTGIRERRIAGPDESLTSLCHAASCSALDRAGITVADVDAIICATVSGDRRMPAQACDLQASLGALNAAAFDISAACPGFVYGLTVGEGLIAAGNFRNVLVLGAEKLSTIVDWTDRSTAILFGDGAGAAVLQKADDSGRGLLSTFVKADGRLAELLYIPGGGSSDPVTEDMVKGRRQYMRMAGREVFKAAVLAMAESCDVALERAGVKAEDIDLLVPHQANLRIIESTAKHAGIPMEKVMVNVDRYGNTSAASIPLALAQAEEEGRLRKGQLALLVAFGAGFTWGATVVRW
ncbi:MAG TPA: beta-ketoacyl-ACP synthase III [Gemmatimonadales bacterium]|nr:beta-ketoacyl-ACP synthase III [Gemmatimonadales bacterium]